MTEFTHLGTVLCKNESMEEVRKTEVKSKKMTGVVECYERGKWKQGGKK